jgi:hypothetical protein
MGTLLAYGKLLLMATVDCATERQPVQEHAMQGLTRCLLPLLQNLCHSFTISRWGSSMDACLFTWPRTYLVLMSIFWTLTHGPLISHISRRFFVACKLNGGGAMEPICWQAAFCRSEFSLSWRLWINTEWWSLLMSEWLTRVSSTDVQKISILRYLLLVTPFVYIHWRFSEPVCVCPHFHFIHFT